MKLNSLFSFGQKHYIALCIITTIVYTLFDISANLQIYGTLNYIDTDNFMRANRMIDWLSNFGWSERLYPNSNYPFGENLHFTRIMDIIWSFFALPLTAFLPLKVAIFYGGMFVSPTFLALSTIMIFWGLKPYLSTSKPIPYTIIFILSFFFIAKWETMFDFNRPDHHAVMFFIFSSNISLILRTLKQTKPHNYMIIAGILSGLGIWASSAVEGFIVVFAILASLSFIWIFYNTSIQLLNKYSLGLLIGLTFAFMINPPLGGYTVLNNTRLSFIHIVMSLLLYTSFYTISRLPINNYKQKTGALLICAIISAGIMFLIFDCSILLAPVYNDFVKQYFIANISEMGSAFHYFYIITYFILGCIIIYSLPTIKEESGSIIIKLMFLFYVALSLYVMRFHHYSLSLFVFLSALYLNYLFSQIGNAPKYRWQTLIYITASLALLNSFRRNIDNDQPQFPEILKNKVVATTIFTGPQLIFEQNSKVVGTPYHNNVEGISDGLRILYSANEQTIKNLLIKHKVEYVYIPKKEHHEKNTPEFAKTLFGIAVFEHQPYKWQETISTTSDKYYLYRIHPELF